jgi:hypothetical protein
MNSFVGKWKVILTQSDVFPLLSMFEITMDANENFIIQFDPNGQCVPASNPLTATTDAGNLVSLSFAVSCLGGNYKIRMLPVVDGRCNGIVQPMPAGTGTASATAATKKKRKKEVEGGDPVGTWTAEEQGGGDVEI